MTTPSPGGAAGRVGPPGRAAGGGPRVGCECGERR